MTKPWYQIRSRRLWVAGLAAAAVSGLALLMPLSDGKHDRKSAALQAVAVPAAQVPPVVTDLAWNRLSAVQQRTLEPLRASWSSMTAEQQNKWRLIADHIRAKPQQVQRRHAERIAEWASLSPQQRAHARLNFLELAQRYNPRQRKEQWQAYRSAKPNQGKVAIAPDRARLVPPAFVRASPGATTVLLSQLFEPPSTNEVAELRGAIQESSPVDEASPQNTGAASAATGSAAVVERAEP
jgi:hypothetical protein